MLVVDKAVLVWYGGSIGYFMIVDFDEVLV